MERIAYDYLLAKRMQKLPVAFSSKSRENCNIVQKVISAYESLNSLEKEFINNQYLNECYKFWWVNKYPPTTYYRYLNLAVRRFLIAYENIN